MFVAACVCSLLSSLTPAPPQTSRLPHTHGKMRAWNEGQFRSQVGKALETVKTVLENTKRPVLAEGVTHRYEDKYLLAEFLTKTALGSALGVLEALGLDEKGLGVLAEWAGSRSVTLRLRAEEKCVFDRMEKREVESATKYVREYVGGFKRTDKVVTTITEWFWKFSVAWEVFAFRGNDPEERVVLAGRSGGCEMVTTTDATPRPKAVVREAVDASIGWLLGRVDGERRVSGSVAEGETVWSVG